MKATRILIALLVGLVAAGAVAYQQSPRFRLAVFYYTGRSEFCDLSQSQEADENLRLQVRYKDEILAASKKLQEDRAGYHLWQTPMGTYWIPEGSDYVLPFNLAEQKRQIYGTGPQAVKSGDIVLDCGANVGVFTRVALDAGAATVVMIEPAPENIECLRRNFEKEIAAHRVVLYPKGVWDKDDVLTLNISPSNSAADSFVLHPDGSEGKIQVPLTTIDHLVKELGLARVDYIKMDIEGAEPKALAGGAATIRQYKPRISISSYHQPDHPVKIRDIILGTRPDYRMECGPCAEADRRVRPDILYFR